MPRAQDRDLATRQHQDPLLRPVIQYLSHGEIPDDDRRARELSITAQQYVVLGCVLYHLETDKTLRVVPPECDRKQLFEEAHGGVFGGHLRGAKIPKGSPSDTGGLI